MNRDEAQNLGFDKQVEFIEIDFPPPGQTDTRFRSTSVTALSDKLDITVAAKYDPGDAIRDLENVQQIITVSYCEWVPLFVMSNGYSPMVEKVRDRVRFHGHLSKFEPGGVDEDGTPQATITITPTNASEKLK